LLFSIFFFFPPAGEGGFLFFSFLSPRFKAPFLDNKNCRTTFFLSWRFGPLLSFFLFFFFWDLHYHTPPNAKGGGGAWILEVPLPHPGFRFFSLFPPSRLAKSLFSTGDRLFPFFFFFSLSPKATLFHSVPFSLFFKGCLFFSFYFFQWSFPLFFFSSLFFFFRHWGTAPFFFSRLVQRGPFTFTSPLFSTGFKGRYVSFVFPFFCQAGGHPNWDEHRKAFSWPFFSFLSLPQKDRGLCVFQRRGRGGPPFPPKVISFLFFFFPPLRNGLLLVFCP